MIVDMRSTSVYGVIKADSKYESIKDIPYYIPTLAGLKCEKCGCVAEYTGKLKDTGKLISLCFEDMLKELDIKPEAERLILYRRSGNS